MKDLMAQMKEKMLEDRGKLKSALVEQVKKETKQTGIPAWRQVQAKDNLGLMDMMKLRNEYGDEALNELFGNIEKLRADGRMLR